MSKYVLRIHNADGIKMLVEIVSHSDCDVNLSNGRGVVDAKSLLGAMSLDHSIPLTLEVIGSSQDEKELIERLSERLGKEALAPCM